MNSRFQYIIQALLFPIIGTSDGNTKGISSFKSVLYQETADPVISRKHGFCSSPFSLTITPSVSGSAIYYTTDGSTPGLSNGILYITPINRDISFIKARIP